MDRIRQGAGRQTVRLRASTGELCFTQAEFARLNHAEICRRLNIGDTWVDETRNQYAALEIEHATETLH